MKFKKLSIIPIFVLVISLIAGTVYADDTDTISVSSVDESTAGAGSSSSADDIPALVQVDLSADGSGNEIYSYGDEFSVSAPSAIVMDMDSGQVLYGKNIFTSRYPASITKVLTGLVCVENGSPEDIVTFDEETVYSIESGSACAGMLIGESITLDQCLRCMMAQSANECAYGAGKTVAGSMEAFVRMMNETASELGCVNSNFANPNGLHDDSHYTCAYDMALIASAAYDNEWFRDFCHLETYNRPLTEMNPDNDWVMYNRHQMFHSDSEYYYEYVTGGKTGYTDQANTTLVTYAEKDGRSLVAVVLNCAGVEVYSSTRALFDYGFDNFTNYLVSDIIDTTIIEELSDDLTITLPSSASVTDIEQVLNTADEKSASISFMYNGKLLGSSDCILTDEYRKYLKDIHSEEIEEVEELVVDVEPEAFVAEDYRPRYLLIFCMAAAGLLIVVIVYLVVRVNIRRRSNRRSSNRPERAQRVESSDRYPGYHSDRNHSDENCNDGSYSDGNYNDRNDNSRFYYRTSEDIPTDSSSDAESYYRSSDYDKNRR